MPQRISRHAYARPELLPPTWTPSPFPTTRTICYSQISPRLRRPISCNHLLGMEHSILSQPKDLPSMPMLDVFLQTNWQLPKLNLTGWRKWELFANRPVPGHHCYTCMAQKASGGWHPCGDYRRLNDVTIPDRYPVPNIQDFSANLTGMRVRVLQDRLDLRLPPDPGG